jgi:MSHA biogenesis protein MshI
MFWGKSSHPLKKKMACCLGDKGYSFALLEGNKLLHTEKREFAEKSEAIAQSLKNDVERFHLVGQACSLVLLPGQYQLVLMDTLESVPKEEMAKALRWRLKGLVDYPQNDIAVDVFTVPPHGVAGQRKKVFVAVTSLTQLKTSVQALESAYLTMESVDIAELALRNALSYFPNKTSAPVIAIGLEEDACQLNVFYQNNLYLTRELNFTPETASSAEGLHNVLLEIQRSVDYCLSELKLPEPKQIILTPSFYQAENLLQFLQQELGKEVAILDLSAFTTLEPDHKLENQQKYFLCASKALGLNPEVEMLDEDEYEPRS